MKKIIIMMVLFASLVNATSSRVCWQYEPLAFKAWDNFTKKNELKPIKDVYIWKKKNNKEIVLVTRVGESVYRHPFISLYEKATVSKYSGECDSGQLQLDKQMNLHLDFLYFMVDEEGYGGPKVELILNQRDENATLKANQVFCPEYVIEGRNVCYTKKEHKRYKECIRSKVSCEKIEKRHFGRYPSESSAEAAYWRCVRSEPK